MTELATLQSTIKQEFAFTNAKIETIQTTLDEKISNIRSDLNEHGERIKQLESYAAKDSHRIDSISNQLEILKQDRLRNNLRLTGLPPTAYDNITDTIMKIVNALQLDLLPSDFIAYTDRNHSSVILAFDNYAHKRYFMDTMRKRNELLVEEVLQVQSNSKIFCNDQLTPYFASLFQKAWQAKKNNQLYAASSLGGRIKVRKTEASNFILVQSEAHLSEIIENIDSCAPAEISTNKLNESPNSMPAIQTKPDTNAQPKNTHEPAHTTNAHYTLPSIGRDRQFNQRHTKVAAPSNDHRNTNRTHQWQQMRYNQNQYNNQTGNSQRYRQQDRRREIELSPNQYRPTNNKSSNIPSLPYRNNNRNYQSRRYDEYY